MSAQRPSFWIVWNPQGRTPTVEHKTHLSAETEAKRLARAVRGQRFIVLQSIGEYIVDDVQKIRHVYEGDDIPF